MSTPATQNPSNKVGRNSGLGEGGVSEVVPSDAEARRGLEPLSTTSGNRRGRRIGRVGAATLIGAGAATLVARRMRRPKSRMQRVRAFMGRSGRRLRGLTRLGR